MINAFELVNGRLKQIQINEQDDLTKTSAIWIDLDAPTPEEAAWIQAMYAIELPEEDDLGDLESSARFYENDDGAIHMHSDFLMDRTEGATSVPIAFITKDQQLFSVHYADSPVFRLMRLRARQPGYVDDCKDVLLDLYATDAEYSADALEGIYEELEKISQRVLKEHLSDEQASDVLSKIAAEEDLNGRIRRSAMDTRRAISFLMRSRLLNTDQLDTARQLLRDIESLDNHTSFLFDKINFLMDATVGFININQNKVIKIFSVASVAMLPPTLIASVYGMNFAHMPELQWQYGYLFSLGLMGVSVLVPFAYFYFKGWLK